MKLKLFLLGVVSFLMLPVLVELPALLAVNTASTPGQLDPTFGVDGIVQTNVGPFDVSTDVAIQPDGKIVIVGTAFGPPPSNFILIRYLTDGTVDQTFGDNGIVITNLSSSDIARKAVIHDGKIVVIGESNAGGNKAVALARYDADGNLDVTFGNNGVVVTPVGFTAEGWDIARQGDGKYVAVGGADDRFLIIRYNDDGSLDDAFGSNGVVHETDVYTVATSVAIQPNGKIVVAGRANGIGLLRYNSDGSRDSSFGANGFVHTGPPVAAAWDMLIQPDGKIVAVGSYASSIEFPAGLDMVVVRYTSSGDPDTSFGDNGRAILAVSAEADEALGVEQQPDGKLLVAGYSQSNQFTLLRLTTDGTLDSGFGTDGITGTGACCRAQALALQPDNKIVVTGFGFSDFITARFENDAAGGAQQFVFLPLIQR